MGGSVNVAIKPILVDLPTAAAIVSLSESTWQELVRTGNAPKPRQTSNRRVAWLLRDIEEWAENRPVSDLAPPPNTGARAKKAA